MAKKIAESPESYPTVKNINLSQCFSEDADGNNARYETHCIDDHVKSLSGKSSAEAETDSSDGAETDSETDADSESTEEAEVESDEL